MQRYPGWEGIRYSRLVDGATPPDASRLSKHDTTTIRDMGSPSHPIREGFLRSGDSGLETKNSTDIRMMRGGG